jgi:enoyl-CoA hydratase/carnithine racemase
VATEPETIELHVDGPVARLTLNQPQKLNALDPAMLDDLLVALNQLANEESTNAVLLSGAGRAFSAGVDVDSEFFFQHGGDSAYAATRSLNRQHKLIEALYELPQLTIAAINGDAIGGGGFGMAMACDIRIAVRSARFWMVPGALDVIQDFGLTWLLQRSIGSARTLHMAVMGEPVTAETGVEWGFVDEVVADPDELTARIDNLAAHLGTLGADPLRMLKLVVRAGGQTGLREQLGLEAIANGLNSHSDGFGVKRAAFLEGLRTRRANR